MDQGPLVIEQVDAGADFINRLDQRIRVRAAFWLKAQDEERWRLYVASEKFNDSSIKAAHEEVWRVHSELNNPHLDLFQIRLIPADDPLALAAANFHRNFVGRVPTRYTGSQFGGVSVDDVYVYPPPPYGADAEKWRGISVKVWPEPEPQGTYRVEFWPREPAAMVPWPGGPKRVPRPAGVLVKEGQVLQFTPPEKAMPHLTQSDYEKKAVEAVMQVAASTN